MGVTWDGGVGDFVMLWYGLERRAQTELRRTVDVRTLAVGADRGVVGGIGGIGGVGGLGFLGGLRLGCVVAIDLVGGRCGFVGVRFVG